MPSWLRPQPCPARGDPAQAGASCPAARPSPRGPRGGHSQRRCCLSAPPRGGRERVGKNGVTGISIFNFSTSVFQKREYMHTPETTLVMSLFPQMLTDS